MIFSGYFGLQRNILPVMVTKSSRFRLEEVIGVKVLNMATYLGIVAPAASQA